MPKKKTPTEKPKDQFKRFVETAKEIGIEPRDAEQSFEKLSVKEGAKVAKTPIRSSRS
jgi:hypothetical protein